MFIFILFLCNFNVYDTSMQVNIVSAISSREILQNKEMCHSGTSLYKSNT